MDTVRTRHKQDQLARRATLSDVARMCGVSVGTASAVLSGKTRERRISDDAAERIRLAAQELDYAPNLLVRSIQRGRTNMVSFFNGFRRCERRDLYMDAIISAILSAAGQRGYDVVVHCDFHRAAGETYRALNGGRTDGLIFFGPQLEDPLLPYLQQSRLPVVTIHGAECDLPRILDDVEAGMEQVAGRLVAWGHSRIAALTVPATINPDGERRLSLLTHALQQRGASLQPNLVQIATHGEPAGIAPALRRLLDQAEPPTALFCWNDRTGYIALEACEQMGLSIPEDLSIVGYDGVHWPARTTHTLTSVRLDIDAMGEAAVVLIDDLIHRRAAPPESRCIPVTFLEGTTLGPARRACGRASH